MSFFNQKCCSPTDDVGLAVSATQAAKWGLRLIWLSYASILFFLTHTAIPQSVSAVTSNWDKALHWGAYCGLAVLTAGVCLKSAPYRVSSFLIFVVLAIFAGLDEILQGPVGRTPDVLDWFFDSLGIVSGLVLMQLILWILNKLHKPDSTFNWRNLWRPNSAEVVGNQQRHGLAP